MKRIGHVVLAAGLVVALGCGGSSSGECAAAPFAVSGPYVAGVTTMMRADVPIEVWYPVDPGAEAGQAKAVYDLHDWLPADLATQIPASEDLTFTMNAYRDVPASAAARFPIVLFTHGLGGYRSQSSFLMTHLATWGFVVAAPEHPERNITAVLGQQSLGDDSTAALRDALEMLKGEDVAAGGRLEGRLDFDHVTVSGHSMGGGSALIVATDAQIHAWFTMATVAPGDAPGKPSLILAGMVDGIAEIDLVKTEYGRKALPKRLAAIEEAGHLAFTDICTIGRDAGGLFGVAQKYGVEIDPAIVAFGTDGCGADNLPPEEGWPVINHFVTAHLRAAFGSDPAPRGLDQAATDCFSGLVAELDQETP